jgi:hypothetical protein
VLPRIGVCAYQRIFFGAIAVALLRFRSCRPPVVGTRSRAIRRRPSKEGAKRGKVETNGAAPDRAGARPKDLSASLNQIAAPLIRPDA